MYKVYCAITGIYSDKITGAVFVENKKAVILDRYCLDRWVYTVTGRHNTDSYIELITNNKIKCGENFNINNHEFTSIDIYLGKDGYFKLFKSDVLNLLI